MKRRIRLLQRGFTLIELLVVVAIIAIISAIAVPKILKALYQSKDKRVMADMRNIAVAIGIYSIEEEMVPQTDNIHDLIAALQDTRGEEVLPFNSRDAWGHTFYYRSMTFDQYTLKSFGRDGGEGTSANTEYFDPNADTVIISGVFRASHQGATAVVGQ